MHSGKTERNIERHSAALSGISDICEQYDSASGTIKRATAHKTVSSIADEQELIALLRTVRPFAFCAGRKYKGIDVPPSSLKGLDVTQFLKWIAEKQNIYIKEIGK